MSTRFFGYGLSSLHRLRIGAPDSTPPPADWLENPLCLPIRRDAAGFTGGLYRHDGSFIEASGIEKRGRMFVAGRAPGATKPCDVLPGSSLYIGPCHSHYGHFLLETILPRLWCLDRARLAAFDNLVILPLYGVPAFVEDFFACLGVRDRLRIIDRPTTIERLLLPHPAIRYPGYVNRAVSNIHALLLPDDKPEEDNGVLFVSRSALPVGKTRYVIGDAAIEAAMRDNGATVFNPELHSLSDQIRTFRRHRTIIGFAGSALHTLALARPRKTVIAYSARRVPNVFPLIDQVMDNDSTYIRAPDSVSGLAPLKTSFQPEIVAARKVLVALQRLGLIRTVPDEPAQHHDEVRKTYNTAVLLRHVMGNKGADDAACTSFVRDFGARYALDHAMIKDACRRSCRLKGVFRATLERTQAC